MQQKMSLTAAIFMNINIMIGAGIFIMPSLMAQKAGALSYLGWPLGGILFLPVVWSISQVTKLFPEQGSFYNYSKKGIGPLAGFISGLVYFLGYVSIIGLQTTGLRGILIRQFGLTAIADHTLLFNAVFIAAICCLNFFSLRIVARIQNSGVLFKLIPIIVVLVSIPLIWNADLPLFSLQSSTNLLMTIPIALFGYWGFESCASISHLIEGDSRNASRAILAGFFITMAIYTLFHLGVLHIMGPKVLSTQGVDTLAAFLPLTPFLNKLLGILISLSICVALISAIFGEFISNSALLNAMAQEKLFFMSEFVSLKTKHGVPWASLTVQAVTSFLVVSIINNQFVLNAMGNLGILMAFFLTLYSLFQIQKRRGDYFSLFSTLLAFASCSILTYYSWQLSGHDTYSRIINCVPLGVFIVLGLGMYVVNRKTA